jgi:hypothetical protein
MTKTSGSSEIQSVPIGRFFSLQNGRVGQYLSPRVLVVRTPFKAASKSEEACYFGFDKLNQAQKFAQYLAGFRYRFELRRSQLLQQFPYEIRIPGNAEIVSVLAQWDRRFQRDQKLSIAA